MEAEPYRRLCRIIDQLSPHRRRAKQQFSDAAVVKIFFYATHHNESVNWACQRTNWFEPLLHRSVGLVLPSQPTMSRRLRSVGVLQLIERVQCKLAEVLSAQSVPGTGSGRAPGTLMVKSIDSKPLRVGCYSKDRDARRGRVGKGEMARGYKLHAITCGDAFKHFVILPMNVNDQVGAAMLLPRLGDDPLGWGYLAGDNGYDANPVYLRAAAVNHQLIAPPRKSNAQVRDVKRNCPQRIRSLDLCANPLGHCGLGENLGQRALRERKQIERNFGHVAMDGLHAPPPWIRTPHRVACWTAAKLIQRMMRQIKIKRLRI